MEEAVPTKSQKASISQDILLVSATVSTLSISAISHTFVRAYSASSEAVHNNPNIYNVGGSDHYD